MNQVAITTAGGPEHLIVNIKVNLEGTAPVRITEFLRNLQRQLEHLDDLVCTKCQTLEPRGLNENDHCEECTRAEEYEAYMAQELERKELEDYDGLQESDN